MATLTIRNLTIHPLELLSVERFEAERVDTGGNLVSSVAGAITGFLNATAAQRPTHELRPRGAAHATEKASVHVPAFAARPTGLRTADPGGREVIRLTVSVAGRKYETDVPSPSKRSASMRAVDGDGEDNNEGGKKKKLELTAVYVPTGALVAVFSSANLSSWMRELHDDRPLTVLSIPGTHNAPTCHTALPSVRCQAVPVRDQLDNGVRFLDVRVNADADAADDRRPSLTLVHSAFPVSLAGSKNLSGLLADVYAFLDRNPSEAVVMSVKREGVGKATDEQMAARLKRNYVDHAPERWWTDPAVPKLGAARGRVVLLRRFAIGDGLRRESHGGRGWALDAQHWPDNCEDGAVDGGLIRVQDFYDITESRNIEKKIEFARRQLERAAEQSCPLGSGGDAKVPPLFVNFLTASNFFSASCWPERIAAKVNPAIVEYLCIRHGEDGKGPQKLKVGSGGTGIVVTDWVGAHGNWDLIRCIVGMNARLQIQK